MAAGALAGTDMLEIHILGNEEQITLMARYGQSGQGRVGSSHTVHEHHAGPSRGNGACNMIQNYFKKTVVIKYGGNAMVNEGLKSAVMQDVVRLAGMGIRVVLVHGGGPEISNTLAVMGKETKFINGLRYTDAETAEVAAMVLAGKVNKSLVVLIQKNGGKAIGLCGLDGGMLQAEKMRGEVDLGYVGRN